MAWRRIIISFLIIVPLIGLLAYGFTRDPRFISSPLLGQPAPPFVITLFGDRNLSLEDLRGKAVFVNFWASWCPPCRAEARDIEAAWQQLKDDDVVFLGINIQDTEPAALAYLKEFNISYPNGRDHAGKISLDYGVWGIPESFFIDGEGRITYKHVGMIPPATIAAKIEEARRGIVSAEEGKGLYQSTR